MKRIMAILSIVILVSLICLVELPKVFRSSVPKKTEKTVLSDDLMISQVQPRLETQLDLCDIAVFGKIIKIEPADLPIKTGTPLDDKAQKMYPQNASPTLPFTKYTIEIIEKIAGTADGSLVECYLLGGLGEMMTKPEALGKVIMILDKNPQGFYVSTQFEHTIYSVDDLGKVTSFSNIDQLEVFDGQDSSVLINRIRTLAK